jgi:hypothetical protein
VSIVVVNQNDPPVANGDSFSVEEDSGLTFLGVLENDTYLPDPAETIRIAAASSPVNNGTVTIDDGLLYYEPSENFFGLDTFSYAIVDEGGALSNAIVEVTVAPVNDPPIAVDDFVSLEPGSRRIVVDVLNNDLVGPEPGETLGVLAVVGRELRGNAILDQGQVVYLAPEVFETSESVDQFLYSITDGNGGVSAANVFVSLPAGLISPVANPDEFEVLEDSENVFLDVLENDISGTITEPSLTVLTVTEGSAGGTILLENGVVHYTPRPDYFGVESFQYTLGERDLEGEPVVVTINVLPVDEPLVPLLAIQDVSQLEGSEGMTKFEFGLEFERPLPSESWIDYDLLDGSATAGQDYVKGDVPLRWVFAQGTQFTNLTVLVTGDVQPESTENFFLSIEDASNILVTDPRGEGIILNDDINTPPVIDAIPDQSVAVGELSEAIGFTVLDIETGASDLEVILESLDPERLPDDLVSLSDDNSENRRIQIGAVTLPTLDDPIRIRVSVIDEHGASAVAEFNLVVTNDLPQVRISSPSNYSILPTPEGGSLLDISVEIEVADDQPVAEVFVSVDSVRLDGLVVPNPLRQNVFDFMWDDVRAGEYTLTATARDSATGDLVLSSPVYIKVVAGGGGEIVIVHPASENRDEIFTIWDYLVDLGHQPQVFLQDEISVELLESYRAVIWHDLGLLDLLDYTVSTLSALQDTKRMPIYFIGERIASSGGDLSEESQNVWAELTKLTPADERVTLSQVNFNPFRDWFQNQISGYWALVDGFTLGGEVDEARAHEDAQVLAVSGENEIPVVLRYPATDVEAQVTARRFVQSFPVEEKGADAATLARRVLFENALCYLLIGEECGCPSAVINLGILTEGNEPISASLGETFEIELKLGNNGRCDVRGGQLSFQLPEGLELIGVQSLRRFAWRWDSELRTAFIAVGILEDSPDDTFVALQVRPLLPGDYGVEIITSGSYFEPHATAVSVEVEGAFLTIDRDGTGGAVLQVNGTAGANVRVEWSDALGTRAVGSCWRRFSS